MRFRVTTPLSDPFRARETTPDVVGRERRRTALRLRAALRRGLPLLLRELAHGRAQRRRDGRALAGAGARAWHGGARPRLRPGEDRESARAKGLPRNGP